jgi:hypothetical protein
MKRLLMLTALIFGLLSVARAQVAAPNGWCMGCTAGEEAEIVAREDRDREVADHNQWPTRPRFTRPNKTHGEITAKFEFANNTNKEIKQVTWECILVSLTTGQPIASYTVVTSKSIAPQSTAVLSKKVKVPLGSFYSKVVPVGQTNQSPYPTINTELLLPYTQYDLPDIVQVEQINQVKQIRYRDGSIGTL